MASAVSSFFCAVLPFFLFFFVVVKIPRSSDCLLKSVEFGASSTTALPSGLPALLFRNIWLTFFDIPAIVSELIQALPTVVVPGVSCLTPVQVSLRWLPRSSTLGLGWFAPWTTLMWDQCMVSVQSIAEMLKGLTKY